ncbi:MAG TPA: HAD family hydrolase [Candidatus Ruthenibacterium merdigallinarum]|nr:HAD family hydrolase [Candidatus Ruthenibacterium merdigallinarum]
MYKAVLFDLDGTLLDTLQDLADAANHTLRALGLPEHARGEYRRMVGNGIPKLIERMLPAQSRGPASQALALEMFRRRYAAHSEDATIPYPGIPALLQTLRAAGVQLGVVSNKDDALARQVVEHYFPGVFDAVAGRRDGVAAKPDPTLVNEMREGFGRAEGETLYVGDSDVDVFTAQNARLACCGALWGFRTKEELAGAGADYLAANADELAQIVLGTM